MTYTRLWPAAILVGACHVAPVSPQHAVSVALVAPVHYTNEMGEGQLWHVQVRSTNRVDTIPAILTRYAAVVAGDSVIVGIKCDEDQVRGVFAFDVRTRRLAPVPELEGWQRYQQPSIAPDGTHLLYLSRIGERYRGVVADLPSGSIVYRGPLVTPLETDAGVEKAQWSSARGFEMTIELTAAVGGRLRMRGSLDPLEVVVDTVGAGRM